MVSANPTGPITVASARNGAYGDSVARLLEFGGHDVEREYYYNDAGAQMDRFRASVEAARRGEEPPEDGYQGDVRRGARARGGRPGRGDARADRGRRSSGSASTSTRGRTRARSSSGVAELLPRLDTYEADGTLWARTTRVRRRQGPRRSLRSADGAVLYFAADVAYVQDKFERGFDTAIYVLGADHHGYVARLKAAAGDARLRPGARRGAALPARAPDARAARQTKMSKRRGDVVFLDEFIDEIGVDAARWYLVKSGPDQTIEIDVDLAAEKSQKNPVYYVQYAHARIAGILRNAGDATVSPELDGAARAGGARADQAAARVPGGRGRRGREARAAGDSRRTRSASPTTSTASTTSIACSRASSRRSGSRSAGRRRS